ncbi:MAG: hypothetical protein R3C03_23405 [Pirellulaceae bacterium]
MEYKHAIPSLIRAILYDSLVKTTPNESDPADARKASGRRSNQSSRGIRVDIETILRSCGDEPEKVDEIDRILPRDENNNIPDGQIGSRAFLQFWEDLKSALDEVNEKSSNKKS